MIWPLALIVGSVATSLAVVTVASLKFAEHVSLPDWERQARKLDKKAMRIQTSWWHPEGNKEHDSTRYFAMAADIRRRGKEQNNE